MSFFVFVLDAIFCGTNFFIFQDTVWLVKSSRCVHYCSIHQLYWLAIVAEADLRCDDFLSEKSCRHNLVVSTSVWSRLLNVSSVLTTKKYSHTFLVCYCAVDLLTVLGSTKFLTLVFMFLKYVFFAFVLDAIFCGTSFFFIFQDTVWLFKSS